ANLADPSQNTGNAAGDSYTNINTLIGTNFNDTLIGDGNTNALEGGAGVDTLIGNGGALDFASYIHAPTSVTANLANPNLNTGDAAGDVYININGLIGSNFADILIGDASDNFLRGRGGGDTLTGSGGSDTADYNFAGSVSGQGLVVDLSHPANNTGDALGDTYNSIEDIRGSGFNDILKGDGGGNRLTGQAGADTFVYVTGGGADFVIDFSHAQGDKIDLTGVGSVHSFADLTISQQGANSVINFGNGDTLTLNGVTAIGLVEGDFIFNPSGFVSLEWKNQIEPLAALAGSSGRWIVPNRDGLTSTEFLGTGFTYDPITQLPTGGTITSMRLVDNLDHTVLQTMTNFTTTLGDLGAFVSNIETLRGQIGWLGVIPGDDVNPVTFTANEILFENTDGTFTRIVGSGFNEIGGLHGTVSAVQHLATDATTVLPDGLSGLNLSLPTLADAISPSNLSDDFYQLAGQGANTLTGFNAQVGSTNNYYINFDATAGNDTINGTPGGGNTTAIRFADYGDAPAAVQVDLSAGSVSGGFGTDVLVNIDGAGGSDFNDTIIGNATGNSLHGSAGNDSLSGGDGDDSLNGGPGSDVLDGGPGNDTADYANFDSNAQGVTANLSNPSSNTGDALGDTYISIENLRGSEYNDILTGDVGANVLTGQSGDDILSGGAGDDYLEGDAGIDTFVYADNGGTDTIADYSHAQGDKIDLTAVIGVNSLADVQLIATQVGLNTRIDFGGGNTLTLNNVVLGNLTANDFIFANHIVGDNNDNVLVGTPGVDWIDGLGGNDTLQGLAGNDRLDGGTGIDRAIYTGATLGPITVDLAAGTVMGDASVGADTLVSVEQIRGTAFNDVYVATGYTGVSPIGSTPANYNEFEGMAGNDIITGNGGTQLSYLNATAGVTVNSTSWVAGQGASGTGIGNASVGTDTFTGVQVIRGSEFADDFHGSNNLTGVEVFQGRGGNDFIDGGGGFDRVTYWFRTDDNVTGGITVNMATGTVAGDASVGADTLRSIEAIRATNFVDTYNATGFTASSTNAGSAGVDGSGQAFNEFEGFGDNDSITGNGNTRIDYINATAAVTVDLQAGTATGDASVGSDTITGGVNSVQGSYYDDT